MLPNYMRYMELMQMKKSYLIHKESEEIVRYIQGGAKSVNVTGDLKLCLQITSLQ